MRARPRTPPADSVPDHARRRGLRWTPAAGSATIRGMELPDLPVQRELVERIARLREGRRGEIGERPMVLPTAEFFPDEFSADQPSIEKLVRRMQAHAGMDDIPIDVRVIAPEGEEEDAGGSCGSGACCSAPAPTAEGLTRLVDNGDSWTLNVPALEVSHSVVLTANIARALGFIFLRETEGDESPIEEPAEASADLCAVELGFGELLLEGSYIYTKSCGGPSIATVTALSTPELAIAFALFCTVGGHPLKRALSELGATQRAALGEARDLVGSNPKLVEALKRTPELVALGHYELEATRPWLMRAFGKKKKKDEAGLDDLEAALAAAPPRPKKPKASSPADDELKDLVAEALAGHD